MTMELRTDTHRAVLVSHIAQATPGVTWRDITTGYMRALLWLALKMALMTVLYVTAVAAGW